MSVSHSAEFDPFSVGHTKSQARVITFLGMLHCMMVNDIPVHASLLWFSPNSVSKDVSFLKCSSYLTRKHS
jgi:hypothetical protein